MGLSISPLSVSPFVSSRARGGGGAAAFPLDAYATDLAAAYSVRRLLTSYEGPAIRVRESGGNTEADIGFDASGDLDTAALLAHCGAGSGYVVTWYDQSGAGNHATNATAAEQPRVVNAGAVEAAGRRGAPAVRWLGSQYLAAPATLSPDAITAFVVGSKAVATGRYSFVLAAHATTPHNHFVLGSWEGGGALLGDVHVWRGGNAFGGGTPGTAPVLRTWRLGASAQAVRRSGTELATGALSGGSAHTFTLGGGPSGFRQLSGTMQDVVIYSADRSGDLAAIEGALLPYHFDLPHTFDPHTFDLFLVGGQSNAMGQGNAALSPAVPAGTAYEYDPYTTHLGALADPVANANDGSAWPAFANAYHAATGAIPVFVGKAVDGSAQAAAADRGSGHWDAGGTHYPEAQAALAAAKAHLEYAGHTVNLRGVLWCQGESDALEIDNATITKATYKAALEAMIARFRTDFGASLPFFVFRTGHLNTGDTAGFIDVRAAQDEVCAADANTHMAFTGAADFPETGKMKDLYHYTQVGYNEMGAAGGVVAAGVLYP